VLTLLQLEAWKDRSSRLIAAHCGVSDWLVKDIKAQLVDSTTSSASQKTTGKDGKQYPAKKPRKAKAPEPEPGPEHLPVEDEPESESTRPAPLHAPAAPVVQSLHFPLLLGVSPSLLLTPFSANTPLPFASTPLYLR
jgi:hypothetical protein